MGERVSIAIVGAGPAGARAGELLARGGEAPVIFDPRAPWEKPCGGGLPAPLFDALPEFRALMDLARPVDLVRVELACGQGFTVFLERPIWIVSRRALSEWQLTRALEAGARHEKVRVQALHRRAGRWRLTTDAGDFDADFVVGADGGASLVRARAAPLLDVELAPTRVAYPAGGGPTPNVMVLRFYPGVPGYLWDFPRPDHRSVGVVVAGGTWRRPRLDREVDRYEESRGTIPGEDVARAGAVIGTAQLGHGEDFSRIAGRHHALLGDAAGLADPLSGEGIENALRSAGLFAAAWLAGRPESYAGSARKSFAHEFARARLLRRMLLETSGGTDLIRGALGSDVLYALVAALVEGLTEHRMSARALVAGWLRAFGRARRAPRELGRGSRP